MLNPVLYAIEPHNTNTLTWQCSEYTTLNTLFNLRQLDVKYKFMQNTSYQRNEKHLLIKTSRSGSQAPLQVWHGGVLDNYYGVIKGNR